MDQTRERRADTHRCSDKASSAVGITETAEGAPVPKSGEEWLQSLLDGLTGCIVSTAEHKEKKLSGLSGDSNL